MEKNFKNISNEIAAIAEQMNNYAEVIKFNGKEFKLTKNNIDNDEWWWRGGNTLSKPNVYECDIEDWDNDEDWDNVPVLYFKFGYGYKRESTAHIIMTDTDTYMVIDGNKVYRVAYIINTLELVDNFEYEELCDVLDSGNFILRNANGKYVYVEHVENYCPINYCELKFNKPCESVTIERWGDYDEKYGVVCRSNGKVTARYEY